MQGDDLEKCMVKAPVVIEAFPAILDVLSFNQSLHQFYIDADYKPQASDDLCTFVCSLFLLLNSPSNSCFYTNGVEDIDKIRSFWEQYQACQGWKKAFSFAQAADYAGLKKQLGKIFHYWSPFSFKDQRQQKIPSIPADQKKIRTGRYPLSPAKGKG
jgi:hypothetical protein